MPPPASTLPLTSHLPYSPTPAAASRDGARFFCARRRGARSRGGSGSGGRGGCSSASRHRGTSGRRSAHRHIAAAAVWAAPHAASRKRCLCLIILFVVPFVTPHLFTCPASAGLYHISSLSGQPPSVLHTTFEHSRLALDSAEGRTARCRQASEKQRGQKEGF